jgi:hypothetical protein
MIAAAAAKSSGRVTPAVECANDVLTSMFRSASARAAATPKTPAARPGRRCLRQLRDHGPADAFPADSMLATSDATPPAGISGTV